MKKLLSILAAAAALFTACSGQSPEGPDDSGENNGDEAVFELLEDAVSVDGVGAEFKVVVRSSLEYEIEAMPEWVEEVSFKESWKEYESSYVFKALKNEALEGRTGEIVFVNTDDDRLTLTVNQKGKPYYHRSFAMRFTADWCGVCPTMAKGLAEAQKRMPDKLVVVNMYNSCNNASMDFDDASKYMSQFRVSGYPTGIVDGRMQLSISDAVTTAKHVQKISDSTVELYSTVTGIGFTSSITGRDLKVDVKACLMEADSYKITVMLVEDGIVTFQTNGGDDYVHNGVVRTLLTKPLGDSFKTTAANETKDFSYTATVNDSYNIDNMRVVVYIERAFGDREKVQSNDFGDYYIDNCAACKIGESVELKYED